MLTKLTSFQLGLGLLFFMGATAMAGGTSCDTSKASSAKSKTKTAAACTSTTRITLIVACTSAKCTAKSASCAKCADQSTASTAAKPKGSAVGGSRYDQNRTAMQSRSGKYRYTMKAKTPATTVAANAGSGSKFDQNRTSMRSRVNADRLAQLPPNRNFAQPEGPEIPGSGFDRNRAAMRSGFDRKVYTTKALPPLAKTNMSSASGSKFDQNSRALRSGKTKTKH